MHPPDLEDLRQTYRGQSAFVIFCQLVSTSARDDGRILHGGHTGKSRAFNLNPLRARPERTEGILQTLHQSSMVTAHAVGGL